MKRFREWLDKILSWFRPKPKPDPDPGFIDVTGYNWSSNIGGWQPTINIASGSIWGSRPDEVQINVRYDASTRIPLHHEHRDWVARQPKWMEHKMVQDQIEAGATWIGNPSNVNLQVGLIRKWNGQWIYGTVDYLRIGQTSKLAATLAQYMFLPAAGDRIGIVVSTLSREPHSGGTIGPDGTVYQERSEPFWVTMP